MSDEKLSESLQLILLVNRLKYKRLFKCSDLFYKKGDLEQEKKIPQFTGYNYIYPKLDKFKGTENELFDLIKGDEEFRKQELRKHKRLVLNFCQNIIDKHRDVEKEILKEWADWSIIQTITRNNALKLMDTEFDEDENHPLSDSVPDYIRAFY